MAFEQKPNYSARTDPRRHGTPASSRPDDKHPARPTSWSPVAHDVLRPHIAPHLLALSYRGEPEPWREEALARLRSVNAQSVTAYQVIELPRSRQDPPEGTLQLALGPHSHQGSWWDQAATYLSNAIEHADQRGDLADSNWKSVFTGW
jgi:hypothetical protein